MGVHDKGWYFDIKRMLKIPASEPIFILRAQDVVSIPTLAQYIILASHYGAHPDFLRKVQDIKDEMSAWQAENDDKVKIPD